VQYRVDAIAGELPALEQREQSREREQRAESVLAESLLAERAFG